MEKDHMYSLAMIAVVAIAGIFAITQLSTNTAPSNAVNVPQAAPSVGLAKGINIEPVKQERSTMTNKIAAQATTIRSIVYLGDFDDYDQRNGLSGNGQVNIQDLNKLLASWGQGNILTDINNDGYTNTQDTNILMALWGTGAVPRADVYVDGSSFCKVDARDLTMVQAMMQNPACTVNSECYDVAADVTKDGVIDSEDVNFVKAQTKLKQPTTAFDREDLNCDRIVDQKDLDIVTASWNTDFYRADINADGVVNIIDLTLVQNAWNS